MAWPDLSVINDLVGMGVSLEAAWDMPPNMTMKLAAIRAASQINPKHRTGGGLQGTAADLRSLLT